MKYGKGCNTKGGLRTVSEDMWDISRPEFGAVFDRFSRVVPLRGATTALQINRRLNEAIRESKTKALTSKVGVVRGYEMWNAEQIDKAKEKDFAGRAIFEANKNPKGIIALTLVLGREEAIERMHAQIRAQVRANRGFKITRG